MNFIKPNWAYVIERASAFLIQEEQFFFSTQGLIHKMTNPHSARMVSIHVYSPPLQNMSVFQEQPDQM
ncbi:hypothetical protein [Ammoniphilus sp. 3BR4]|uniref:hypothetical protein n=1 Tax=Ammoniphilus sp. 3BR4 TaxID=3158265 RepID=UPI0034671F39